MGSDDYSAAVSGGLKLKGSKPSGVTKKKKKSKPKDTDDSKATATQSTLADEERAAAAESSAGATGAQEGDGNEEEEYEPSSSKTEAERKYEDMRRKRLDERLKKEGVKTHKQRVEELNKYLSTLSEHHDMPRIGPG